LKKTSLKILREILVNPQTTFFVGAGASWDSGLPLGDSASTMIISALFRSIGERELWRQLNNNINEVGWPRFEVTLSSIMKYLPNSSQEIIATFSGIGVSSTHLLLSSLSSRPRIWLTTNFDDQIERALFEKGQELNIISSREAMTQIDDQILSKHLVIKLHGDQNSVKPDTDLGVRIEQILRTFPESAQKKIAALISNRPLVVIGYAARDPDIIPLLTKVLNNSPLVVWINLGKPTPLIGKLSEVARKFYYCAEGSPAVICNSLGISKPSPIRNTLHWRKSILEWAKTQNKQLIVHALSAICLDRHTKETRDAVVHLLKHISPKESQSLLWLFETKSELFLRGTAQQETQIDTLKKQIKKLIEVDFKYDKRVVAQASLILANLEFRSGNAKESATLLYKAEKAAEKSNENELRLRSLLNLGITQLFVGSNEVKKSEKTLRRAIQLASPHNNPVLEAEAVQRLAILLMRTNRELEAIGLLHQIENLLKEIGDPWRLNVWQINLAEALRISRNFKEAVKINENIISNAELRGDEESLIKAKINLGLCFTCIGKIISAEYCFLESMKLSTIYHGETLGNSEYNLGWLRVVSGRWSSAIKWLNRAKNSFENYGSSERQGGALALCAWCYLRLGKIKRARNLFESVSHLGIVPESFLYDDYEMVKIALDIAFSNRVEIHKLIKKFRSKPEQLFYLLEWLLATQFHLLNHKDLKNAFENLVFTAREAGLKTYFCIILALVNKESLISEQFNWTKIDELSDPELKKILEEINSLT